MKIGTDAQLAVKWANQSWSYYRVSRHRSFESLIDHFTAKLDFRFALIFEYDKRSGARGRKIGYFDKNENELNL